jgi:hypothetical protein
MNNGDPLDVGPVPGHLLRTGADALQGYVRPDEWAVEVAARVLAAALPALADDYDRSATLLEEAYQLAMSQGGVSWNSGYIRAKARERTSGAERFRRFAYVISNAINKGEDDG